MSILPPAIAQATQPLFERLPLEEAMPALLPRSPAAASEVAAKVVADLGDPILRAAIWLYVDELDRSHDLSQGIENEIGAFWHGIMHRREGDFWNSKYWFRRAGSLPARLGLRPDELTDAFARVQPGENPADLLEAQRREWKTLFDFCAGASE